MLPITSVYAGLLALLLLVLAVRIIMYRRKNRIAYGNADKPRFTAMISAQSNFAEYAPIGLILLAVAELNGTDAAWLHTIGVMLLMGRMMHGLGLSFHPRQMLWRTWGMMLTLTAILLGAIIAIVG